MKEDTWRYWLYLPVCKNAPFTMICAHLPPFLLSLCRRLPNFVSYVWKCADCLLHKFMFSNHSLWFSNPFHVLTLFTPPHPPQWMAWHGVEWETSQSFTHSASLSWGPTAVPRTSPVIDLTSNCLWYRGENNVIHQFLFHAYCVPSKIMNT